jgi:hypothetical protein
MKIVEQSRTEFISQIKKITNSEPTAQRAAVSKDLAPPFLRRRDFV